MQNRTILQHLHGGFSVATRQRKHSIGTTCFGMLSSSSSTMPLMALSVLVVVFLLVVVVVSIVQFQEFAFHTNRQFSEESNYFVIFRLLPGRVSKNSPEEPLGKSIHTCHPFIRRTITRVCSKYCTSYHYYLSENKCVRLFSFVLFFSGLF